MQFLNIYKNERGKKALVVNQERGWVKEIAFLNITLRESYFWLGKDVSPEHLSHL